MKKPSAGGPMRALIILFFASFLLYGVYFNGFGTTAAATMAFFAIGEAQQGMIMTVASVGSVVITVILGLFGERINKISGIALGAGLMGLAGIAIGTLPSYMPQGTGYGLMLAFSLLGGIGFITVDLLMNGAVADVYAERKSTLLPFVHAFFGAGSMIAPLFVAALTSPDHPATFARPYLAVGIASMVVCAALFVVGGRVRSQTPYANMSAMRAGATENPAEIFRDRRAWLYLIACFLYLSFQTGLATWLPKYCMETMAFSYDSAAAMVTVYFLGSLAIRFLSPVICRRIRVRSFCKATLVLSAIVYLIFLLVPMPPIAAQLMLFLTGFLHGSSVPCMVILCCDAFPTRTASASSAIVLGVSLSSLISPVVMGALIEAAGYMTPMLVITALLPLAAVVLHIIGRIEDAPHRRIPLRRP